MEQTLTLSDEAYEQATMYGLGKPLSEYPPQSEKTKKAMAMLKLVGFLFWLLISAFFVGLFLLMRFLMQPAFDAPDLFTRIMNTFLDTVLPGLFLLTPLLMGIFMFRSIRMAVTRLVVCTNGILTFRNKHLEATTWEQITALRLRPMANQTRTSSNSPSLIYRIERSNGSSITLDATRGGQVEAQYIEACAPMLLAQYQSGAPLTFGKLTLDATGLTFNVRTLPWREVDAVREVQSPPQLNIFQQGRNKVWATLRSRDVPCLALVDQVIWRIREPQENRD